MLPLVLAVHIHEVSAAVIGLVGLLALALALVGISSLRKSGNRALAFVVAAFLVFAVKGGFSAWAIYTDSIAHEHLELFLALADLLVVGLLLAPLLTIRRARAA